MGTIGWGGYVLGDENAKDGEGVSLGHDLTILGKIGVGGLGTAPRDTVTTPNARGGDTRGSSVSRGRLITADGIRCTDRARLLAFLGTMAPIAADDEQPLVLTGFLWGDPDEEGSAVQLWAGPERADPTMDVQALGVGDYRLSGTSWLATDPTFFTVDATTLTNPTPAATRTLTFNNIGNGSTLSGRAWTASITAGPGGCTSPFIDLGDQRVTWAGLTLPPDSTMVIDRHRHSYIGNLGLDGYRTSHGSPDPDWPVTAPGTNEFLFGCATGSIVPSLSARSTWSM